MTGHGECSANRAALIPSIEAVLFSEPTMNRAALDPRLRKTVRTLLNEWASLPLPAVDVEDGEILWQRLLAKHGPCTCGSGDYDPCLDVGGRGSCQLCVSLPGGWPCPAWSGSGYGSGAVAGDARPVEVTATAPAPNEHFDGRPVWTVHDESGDHDDGREGEAHTIQVDPDGQVTFDGQPVVQGEQVGAAIIAAARWGGGEGRA